ncbi:FAD-binding oxidoreductase [Streptomyces sp. NPDC005876]|uniref:FAD-binding oxidoreductase n=1 Tax=Streptomyces sp. NPDC005876 TaxID=3157076 RepID=UPI00341084EE
MTGLNRRRFLLSGSGAAVGAAVTAAGPASAAPAAARPAGTAGPEAVVVTRADSRFGDLISGLNQRFVADPDRVVLPRTTEQVVDAVQRAVDEGKRISIRGGGHCFEDFVFHSDTRVVIDMRLMDRVSFDTDRSAFAVEGGATLLHVYECLYQGWGVTLPGGACYSVGVGGHVSGGGYGMLSRAHGLTVDHLHAVEVVVVGADGRARGVVATRDPDDPHHDLFWAHTGAGGGNFGVITRYWFRSPDATGDDPRALLPRPPAEVFIASAAWPWDDITKDGFTGLLEHYGTWLEEHSDAASPYAGLCSWLMPNHRAAGDITLLAQMDATAADAPGLLRDFCDGLNTALGLADSVRVPDRVGTPARSRHFTVQRLPWLRATRYVGTGSPTQTDPNMRGKHKSAYHRKGFTRAQIDTIHEHLTTAGQHSRIAGLVIPSTGGRIASVAPGATAVAQRDSIMKVTYEAYWDDPADDAANIRWVREVYADVYAATGGVPVPDDRTDGCYVNYPDADLGDPRFNRSAVPWHHLYYKDNYRRLRQVKRRWDPNDVFRHRQSVRP